ncbi:MAG: hypothetical protein NTU60_05310, partial [Candidatus Aminicenantes bacterium]|nr:hypothetical protein [Candidatus Aminicenantes bacterium]
MKTWIGVLTGVILSLSAAHTGWAQGPAQESPMQYVALYKYALNGIALAPDGRILVATNAGVWEVRRDSGSCVPLPGAGLPRLMDKCFVSQVAVTSAGAVFIIVGTDAIHLGYDGVFRLNSGATTWEPVGKETLMHAKTNEVVNTLAVLPDDTLFCTVQNTSAYRGRSKVAKLLRSTNAGNSWEETPGPEFPCLHFGPIAAGPQRQMWMIAGEWELSDGKVNITCWTVVADDWRATPLKWRISTLQPGTNPAANGFGAHENVITRVACDRKGNTFALVTDGRSPFMAGVYRSSDKGGSWKRVTSDKQSTLQRLAMVVAPDDQIYVSTYGGIQRSLDAGSSWTDYAGVGSFVTDLLIDREGYLWASTSSRGLSMDYPGLFRSKQPVGAGTNLPSTPISDIPKGYPVIGGAWSSGGHPESINQDANDRNRLVFFNHLGMRSNGFFENATTVVASDWQGGLRGDLRDGGNTIA